MWSWRTPTATPTFGRVVNALIIAKDFKLAGDDVRLIFDGAKTKWLGVLSDPNHKAHQPYQDAADVVFGTCGHFARAFGAEHDVHEAHVDTLDEFHGRSSFRNLVNDGYTVITF